jgi:hypothetical protein
MWGWYRGVVQGIRELLPLIITWKNQICLAGAVTDFQANLTKITGAWAWTSAILSGDATR